MELKHFYLDYESLNTNELNDSQKLLAIIIFDECYKHKNACNKTNKELAAILKVREEAISRNVTALINHDIIQCDYHKEDGLNRRTIKCNSLLNTDFSKIAVSNKEEIVEVDTRIHEVDLHDRAFLSDLEDMSVYSFFNKYSRQVLLQLLEARFPNSEELRQAVLNYIEARYLKSPYEREVNKLGHILKIRESANNSDLAYALLSVRAYCSDDMDLCYKRCTELLNEAVAKGFLRFHSQNNEDPNFETWQKYVVQARQNRDSWAW